MIILKGLKKLLVLPIILVLVFIWLIVKTLVSLYEIVHGIVYLFVIIFSILLIAVYGDWLQTGLLAVIGFTSFLLLAVASTIFIIASSSDISFTIAGIFFNPTILAACNLR